MKFYKEKFKELRKKSRWSITALAEAANTTRQSISLWENGKRIPSEKSLRQLAKILKISVADVSDLNDYHPTSEHYLKENIDNGLSISNIPVSSDYTSIAVSAIQKLNKSYMDLSITLNALLFHANNIIYLKGIDSKYIIANTEYISTLGFKENYIIKGKTDLDILNNHEAKINSEQDNKVFQTGEPVLNQEQIIPGTRKKRWGIVSKIPVLDNESNIIALLGVIVDITERLINEKYRKILEYAVNKSKTSIWVGKGIPLDNNFSFFKDVLYFKPGGMELFWGDKNPETMSHTECYRNWYESVSVKTIEKHKLNKTNIKFPHDRYYYVQSPYTKNKVWVKETIHYDNENKTYISFITEDSDNLKLKYLSKVIHSFSNIIIWTGCTDEAGLFEYSYLSNTENITGYPKEDFIDNKINFKQIAADEYKSLFEQMHDTNDYPMTFEFKIKGKNGIQRWLKGSFYKEFESDLLQTETFFGYFVDISEEKYLEEALIKSELEEMDS